MSTRYSFELRKLFRNRLLLLMLVLLSLLNLYRIYSGYAAFADKEPQFYAAYFQIQQDVSGEWNNDTIRYVTAEYKKAKAVVDAGGYSTEPGQPGTHTGYVFGDMNVFEQIRDDMDRRYHCADTMQALAGRAQENAAFYERKGNSAEAARNRKIAETYRDRRVTAYYDTWGLNTYFKYDFSTLLLLLLIIPMLSPLFAGEHETGMYGLLRLTPKAGSLPLCKLAAGVTAVCAVCILFFAEDFLAFRKLYHISGLSQPVCTLEGYFYSPLSVSIGTYILLNAALKIMGFLVLGGICTAVSAAVRNEMLPFCMTAAVTLALLLADAFLDAPVLSVLNPVTLLHSGALFREFQTVSVCGTQVFSYWLPVLAAAAEWLALAALTVLRQKENKP